MPCRLWSIDRPPCRLVPSNLGLNYCHRPSVGTVALCVYRRRGSALGIHITPPSSIVCSPCAAIGRESINHAWSFRAGVHVVECFCFAFFLFLLLFSFFLFFCGEQVLVLATSASGLLRCTCGEGMGLRVFFCFALTWLLRQKAFFLLSSFFFLFASSLPRSWVYCTVVGKRNTTSTSYNHGARSPSCPASSAFPRAWFDHGGGSTVLYKYVEFESAHGLSFHVALYRLRRVLFNK